MGLFKLGQVVATPAALQYFGDHGIEPLSLLARHAGGDWGDLEQDDITANENAVAYGDRIFSSYKIGDSRLWVITEADRSSTCILLPEDY